MSIHMDQVSFGSLKLHRTTSLRLGEIARYRETDDRAEFFSRDLIVQMGDERTVIELFAYDRGALLLDCEHETEDA